MLFTGKSHFVWVSCEFFHISFLYLLSNDSLYNISSMHIWCWVIWGKNITKGSKEWSVNISGWYHRNVGLPKILFWSFNPLLSSVQLLSRVQPCDPMNHSMSGLPVHHQLLESTQTMSIESVMPSNHLILCHPLLLLLSILPSTRVFSNESVLCIRWPKYGVSASNQSFQWTPMIYFL